MEKKKDSLSIGISESYLTGTVTRNRESHSVLGMAPTDSEARIKANAFTNYRNSSTTAKPRKHVYGSNRQSVLK